MLFTEMKLDAPLQRALADAGFVTPTPIQAAAIPVALAGRDLVGTAPTGTGKTAAFVLPILQRIIAAPSDRHKTRAVILAPTRELVEQILAVVRELARQTEVRAAAVYGGVSMRQQIRALHSGVEIIIACPGRLLDHMRRGNADFRNLECLVLDEADRMLDMGFMPAIQDIIDHMPPQRQTLLFSATFAKTLNAFVRQTLRDPARVEVDTAVPAQTVRHTAYKVKGSEKMPILAALLRKLIPDSESVLIFTRTRETANRVAEHLDDAGMLVDVLHAEKTQRVRQDTMEQFRCGNVPYLVATDIAARGIDVTCISHVINYDVPASAEDYLHRIGRTGRAERTGHAISLVTRGDARTMIDIERMVGKRIAIESLADINVPENDDDAMPATQRAPRAERRQQEFAPVQEERPRRSTRTEVPPLAAHRAARPETRRDHAAAPHTDRPKGARYADAPPPPPARGKRAYHADSDHAPAGRPPRTERPDRRRGGDAPAPAFPVSRTDRFAKDRYPEAPAGRAPRAERPDRRRSDGDAPPPRRERPAGPRAARDTAEAPRQEHAPGKRFTGRASVAKHHKKHGAGKRQPGEVRGPRSYDPDAPPPAATFSPGARRGKRAPGRKKR
jgi:ATP-dependent RNA helicase RhlE